MKYNNSSKKDIEKNENIANESISNVVSYENKYIEYLKETNKNREETNKKELDLLKLYEEIDSIKNHSILSKLNGHNLLYFFTKLYIWKNVFI